MNDLSVMVGKTMVRVEKERADQLVFISTTGDRYVFFHSVECCENVEIESITGDLDDLVGQPLLIAEERTSSNKNPPWVIPKQYQDSWTWTFYTFATAKGYVDVRWYGESNGCYSEAVDFMYELKRMAPAGESK